MISTILAAGGRPEFRMGVSWGPTYGFPPAMAEPFLPQARQLGATATRITLYWSQLEPQEGVARWDDLDAYLEQLETPEEGMITLAAASPWATRTNAWVFPSSPAKDGQAYCAFIRRVVEHVCGRVRFFQNETEPSNPFFWSGTTEEYAAQQKLFYQTVREADSSAVVVLAGFNGLFDPTGADPLPDEDANVEFLKRILEGVSGAFDVFDIHLYADPYTIPARIEAVRQMMRAAGAERPVMAGEYAGPSFFEFKANRRWHQQLEGPGASAENVRKLQSFAAELPVETRMFLPGADAEMAARLLRLQSEDLMVRNLLALASGVTRTAFFDLWHDAADGDAPNTVLWGAFRLLERDGAGALRRELPLSRPFQRLATALAGATLARRIPLEADADVYAFRVEREERGPLLVAWRRAANLGGTSCGLPVEIPWPEAATRGVAIDGTEATFKTNAGSLAISLLDLPIMID
jgi:hypothetical protein